MALCNQETWYSQHSCSLIGKTEWIEASVCSTCYSNIGMKETVGNNLLLSLGAPAFQWYAWQEVFMWHPQGFLMACTLSLCFLLWNHLLLSFIWLIIKFLIMVLNSYCFQYPFFVSTHVLGSVFVTLCVLNTLKLLQCKMADILRTIFSQTFSWMHSFV